MSSGRLGLSSAGFDVDSPCTASDTARVIWAGLLLVLLTDKARPGDFMLAGAGPNPLCLWRPRQRQASVKRVPHGRKRRLHIWNRRGENVMTLPSQELRPVDLRDVPLDQLAT